MGLESAVRADGCFAVPLERTWNRSAAVRRRVPRDARSPSGLAGWSDGWMDGWTDRWRARTRRAAGLRTGVARGVLEGSSRGPHWERRGCLQVSQGKVVSPHGNNNPSLDDCHASGQVHWVVPCGPSGNPPARPPATTGASESPNHQCSALIRPEECERVVAQSGPSCAQRAALSQAEGHACADAAVVARAPLGCHSGGTSEKCTSPKPSSAPTLAMVARCTVLCCLAR